MGRTGSFLRNFGKRRVPHRLRGRKRVPDGEKRDKIIYARRAERRDGTAWGEAFPRGADVSVDAQETFAGIRGNE